MILRAWNDINLHDVTDEFVTFWKDKNLTNVESAFIDSLEHARSKGRFKKSDKKKKTFKEMYGHLICRTDDDLIRVHGSINGVQGKNK